MVAPYVDAVNRALGGIVDLLVRLALPLAVLLGLVAVAYAVASLLQRDGARPLWPAQIAGHVWGYAAVAILVAVGWAGLRAVLPLARQAVQWREAAEATTNPVPDAPPVYQFQPAVGALAERTYTRTLTVPPYLLERVGAEGVAVLAPYLSDPSAENVLRLVDTFRRSGSDVVFTREVTRLDEEPIPFTGTNVRVTFQPLVGRAYDAVFEGRYTFGNAGAEPITARFVFPLPHSGTIRDLSVAVGSQAVTEPGDNGAYEWQGTLAPRERREAVARYRVTGARSWHYDLGSRRRRVQQFRLDADAGGPVRFLRGSLQPTSSDRGALRWELASVVTAQQVALAFPPGVEGRDSYLQALSALPPAFILFLVGVLAIGWRLGRVPRPGPLAGSLVPFALGLGASQVLANYLGAVAGVLIGPLAGAVAAAALLGPWSLLAAVPAALLPAAFLSPEHSGLLVLLLVVLSVSAALLARRHWRGGRV